jgi:CheY-like chemotaxis protein
MSISRDGMISSKALVVDDHAATCTLIRDVLSAADIEA